MAITKDEEARLERLFSFLEENDSATSFLRAEDIDFLESMEAKFNTYGLKSFVSGGQWEWISRIEKKIKVV